MTLIKTAKLPQIKFMKKAVPEILAGIKTMEARPRGDRWISVLANAEIVELTYGPRFQPARVFAVAKIERLIVKPFADATDDDVRRFGQGWQNKPTEDFIARLEKWYSRDPNHELTLNR